MRWVTVFGFVGAVVGCVAEPEVCANYREVVVRAPLAFRLEKPVAAPLTGQNLLDAVLSLKAATLELGLEPACGREPHGQPVALSFDAARAQSSFRLFLVDASLPVETGCAERRDAALLQLEVPWTLTLSSGETSEGIARFTQVDYGAVGAPDGPRGVFDFEGTLDDDALNAAYDSSPDTAIDRSLGTFALNDDAPRLRSEFTFSRASATGVTCDATLTLQSESGQESRFRGTRPPRSTPSTPFGREDGFPPRRR